VSRGESGREGGRATPLCSRNGRSRKTLVGRAQFGSHPDRPFCVTFGRSSGERNRARIVGLFLLFILPHCGPFAISAMTARRPVTTRAILSC
jgi:hypothetical protein